MAVIWGLGFEDWGLGFRDIATKRVNQGERNMEDEIGTGFI